jgi:hypothetical protein
MSRETDVAAFLHSFVVSKEAIAVVAGLIVVILAVSHLVFLNSMALIDRLNRLRPIAPIFHTFLVYLAFHHVSHLWDIFTNSVDDLARMIQLSSRDGPKRSARLCTNVSLVINVLSS